MKACAMNTKRERYWRKDHVGKITDSMERIIVLKDTKTTIKAARRQVQRNFVTANLVRERKKDEGT